jgi:hypothetical protein
MEKNSLNSRKAMPWIRSILEFKNFQGFNSITNHTKLTLCNFIIFRYSCVIKYITFVFIFYDNNRSFFSVSLSSFSSYYYVFLSRMFDKSAK